MGNELNIEGLLLRIATALVDHPEVVKVKRTTTQTGTMFEVTVAPADVGKMIGKQGRNARAIRELLSAIGSAAKSWYGLDIVMTS